MYRKVIVIVLGWHVLVLLVSLVAPRFGISPFAVFPFAIILPMIGLGCIPLLFILAIAILATPDDPQVRSENLRRCGRLLVLAILCLLPLLVAILILH